MGLTLFGYDKTWCKTQNSTYVSNTNCRLRKDMTSNKESVIKDKVMDERGPVPDSIWAQLQILDGDIVDNIFNQKDSNAHLEMDFESATKYVRGMAGSANQEDLLFFYARYKQATVGPCDAPKPSFYQMKEKSKWNAWNELGNKSRVEAQLEYIQRLSELAPEWQQTKISEPGERGWVSVSLPSRVQESAVEKNMWDYVQSGNISMLKMLAEPLTQYRDENGLTLLHWATDRD